MRARSGPAAVATAPGPAGTRMQDLEVGNGALLAQHSTTAREPDPSTLARAEVAAYLKQVVAVTVWPFTGKALGLSRPAAYRAAIAGEIHCLRLGRRRVVPAVWLARTLMLDDSTAP